MHRGTLLTSHHDPHGTPLGQEHGLDDLLQLRTEGDGPAAVVHRAAVADLLPRHGRILLRSVSPPLKNLACRRLLRQENLQVHPVVQQKGLKTSLFPSGQQLVDRVGQVLQGAQVDTLVVSELPRGHVSVVLPFSMPCRLLLSSHMTSL